MNFIRHKGLIIKIKKDLWIVISLLGLFLSLNAFAATDSTGIANYVTSVTPMPKKLICYGSSRNISYDNDSTTWRVTDYWRCDGSDITTTEYVCPSGMIAIGIWARHYTDGSGADTSQCYVECARATTTFPSTNCFWQNYDFNGMNDPTS